MLALLPPSSRVTRFTCSAQPAMMRLPTSVEPVKQIFPTFSWVTKRHPMTLPRPGSTWKTSSGIPASWQSSAMRMAVSGVSSAGFSTTAFPAARAGANPHEAIGMGKFQGTMIPTTPIGSRNVMSMPPGTGIWRPKWRSGAPAK